MYYGRTPAILTGTAHTNNGIQILNYTLTSAFPTYPNLLMAPPTNVRGVLPSIYVFAPDYVQPLTHQWDLNIEKAVSRNASITLGYLGVRGQHLTRDRDINLFPAQPTFGAFAPNTSVTFLRHPGTGAPQRANPNFDRITMIDSSADSIYHGVFIQFTKRYSRHLQFMTSYTFSHVIDDAPERTAVVKGTDDAKLTQDTLYPNLDRGNGDSDVRHRFVLSSVWDIDYGSGRTRRIFGGFQLAPIVSIQSGRFFSATVNNDPNNDGNLATDRPPYVGRNTIEGPGYASVDVRLSRDIPFSEAVRKFRIIAEAFNLTNRANFSVFNRGQYTFNATTRVFTPTTNFRVNTATFDPRVLQIAAKFIF